MTTIIPNPGTITTERDHPVHRLMMTTRAPTMPATTRSKRKSKRKNSNSNLTVT